MNARALLSAVLLGLSIVTTAAPCAAAAGTPAGVVMAVTGATNPSLPVMSEIPAQTGVVFDPDTSMTFILYSRCKLVTVKGGTLTFTGNDFTTSGQIVSESDTVCPGRFDLAALGVDTGGVVFRTMVTPLKMAPEAQIIFAGGRYDQVTSAVLYAAKTHQALIHYDLYLRRAIAPRGSPEISSGMEYELAVTLSGKAEPVEIPIVGGRPGDQTFVVIRIN